LNDGISINEFKEKYDFDIEKEYQKVIPNFIDTGFMEKSENRLRLTRKALFVSNSIFSEFI